MTRWIRASACLAVLVGLAGCAKKSPPKIVEVSGVLMLDGQPLPKASVQFIPMLADFGAEYNSYALTDDHGRFTLNCPSQSRNGAAVGKHKVVVTENTPEEFRGMDERAQTGLTRYLAGLKNRPIPDVYGNVLNTPLEVEVTADKQEYRLDMKRR